MLVVDDRRDKGLNSVYPRQACVHQVFRSVVTASPAAPALLTAEKAYSYAEIDLLSGRVARRLRASGVGAGSLVAVLTERSPETVIAWLAVLRCGAAYLPLDAAYPPAALRFMLDDSRPAVVLRARDLCTQIQAPAGTAIIDLEVALADNSLDSTPWSDVLVDATAPAYVMYTSGSTGKPKGVVVPHRGIVRLVRDQNYMEFGSDEVFLLVSALTFDVSTWEVWGALLNGARLAIVPSSRLSLDQIGDAVRRFRVTSIYLTSALFNVVIDHDPGILRGVKRLLVGGDVMSPEHSRRAIAALPGCELVNAYGPTEATTYCVCYRLDPMGWGNGSVPIGVPLNHDSAYILDEQLAPVADGEIGMLWAAGDGVALGYLNRPELTGERFKPDRFSGEPGAKMYFTGDLARKRPDGLIECLGRIDRQVKIDGKRIELDEIEHALRQDESIADAVTMLDSEAGNRKRIIAFLKPTAAAAGSGLRETVLVAYRARMPEHMVPHETHVVDDFPFNRNGKVDRQALLAKVRAAPTAKSASRFVDASQLEKRIADLWRATLGHEEFNLDQSLFDVGGTSLAAVEIHAQLQMSLMQQIPIATLFAHPTIAGLARHLEHGQRDKSAAEQVASQRADRRRSALARQREAREGAGLRVSPSE